MVFSSNISNGFQESLISPFLGDRSYRKKVKSNIEPRRGFENKISGLEIQNTKQ